ncbi:MAG: peptidylprolyl isomerase [Planctomycetota bacterium]
MKTVHIERVLVLLLWVLLLPTAASALTLTDEGNALDKDSAIQAVRTYIAEQTTAGRIKKDTPRWKQSLPKFPTVQFDEGSNYIWNLKTSQGDIEVLFNQKIAPQHVANFIYLTELGFFDGLGFHRVITGFMAQGGCPQGSGRGNPGYRFAGEFDATVKHNRKGLLSMANAGPGTDGSQFFLTFVPTPWLDGRHTIFGAIRSGDETMQAFEKRGSRSGKPSEKLTIEKATISIEAKAKKSDKKEAPKETPKEAPKKEKS